MAIIVNGGEHFNAHNLNVKGELNPKTEDHGKAMAHLSALFKKKSYKPASISEALDMVNRSETVRQVTTITDDDQIDALMFNGSLSPSAQENRQALNHLAMMQSQNKSYVPKSLNEGLLLAYINR